MSASPAARVAQLAARPEVQGDPHAVVAAALLVAEGRAECTSRDIATRLGYASHHVVGDLLDPTSGAALLLGDAYAPPRELAVGVLRAILGELEAGGAGGQSETETVDRLGHALNAALRRLLDDLGDNGRVDDHAALAGAFRAIEGIARRGAEASERRARDGAK